MGEEEARRRRRRDDPEARLLMKQQTTSDLEEMEWKDKVNNLSLDISACLRMDKTWNGILLLLLRHFRPLMYGLLDASCLIG